LQKYNSATQAAIALNIRRGGICDCARGVLKTFKGLVFKYTGVTKVIIPKTPKSIIPKVNKPKVMSDEVKHRISETNKLRWPEERHQQQSLNNPKNKPVLQYTLQGEFIKEFYNVAQAVKELGLKHHTNIAQCARGVRHKAAGFIWRYKSNI
jgi:hypothetical protein